MYSFYRFKMSTLLHQVADPGFFFIAAKRAKTEHEGIFYPWIHHSAISDSGYDPHGNGKL